MSGNTMLAHEHVSDSNENRELVQLRGISFDQFLIYEAGNQDTYHKLEYIEGKVFAMAGGSDEHSALSGEIFRLMANHLGKKAPCRAFNSDKRTVKDPQRALAEGCNSKGISVYADASVHCRDDKGEYQPLILVEVLSDSTGQKDRADKVPAYKMLPSVKEIVLVNQTSRFVEAYSRAGDVFSYSTYRDGDSFVLHSIGLEINVGYLYEGILPEG